MIPVEYNFYILKESFIELGVSEGDCIYLTGNIGMIGPSKTSKTEVLKLYIKALQNIIGIKGTIVVPTHSFSLCNTEQIFDEFTTQSETGPITQYVLDMPDSVRQFHPFSSRAAIGYNAKAICGDCSRSSYGYHTPFQRMLKLDAKFISIGMHPRLSVSLVHQCEQDMAVPYRYNKEFIHPVLRDGEVKYEPFYHLVTYKDIELTRNKNQYFFQCFIEKYHLEKISFGQGYFWAFNMRDFYESTTNEMKKNIYSWLEHPPQSRPYQK
jgi:aminoglycoside 3-N-acetyltransferase